MVIFVREVELAGLSHCEVLNQLMMEPVNSELRMSQYWCPNGCVLVTERDFRHGGDGKRGICRR